MQEEAIIHLSRLVGHKVLSAIYLSETSDSLEIFYIT